jgi:hypothetical protein
VGDSEKEHPPNQTIPRNLQRLKLDPATGFLLILLGFAITIRRRVPIDDLPPIYYDDTESETSSESSSGAGSYYDPGDLILFSEAESDTAYLGSEDFEDDPPEPLYIPDYIHEAEHWPDSDEEEAINENIDPIPIPPPVQPPTPGHIPLPSPTNSEVDLFQAHNEEWLRELYIDRRGNELSTEEAITEFHRRIEVLEPGYLERSLQYAVEVEEEYYSN